MLDVLDILKTSRLDPWIF